MCWCFIHYVEFYFENKFEKLVHLVDFIIRTSRLPPPNVKHKNEFNHASHYSRTLNGGHKVIFTFLKVSLFYINLFATEMQPP